MYGKLIGIACLAVAMPSAGAPPCIVAPVPAADGLRIVSYQSESRQVAAVPSAPREFTWAGDAATALAAATGDAVFTPAPPPVPSDITPVSALPPADTVSVPVVAPLAPPLDVAMLKSRLRNTAAIGLFTKLELRNQMDDLLEQFKTHYRTDQPGGVDALRPPYDLLLLKVLALLQDRDPTLASTILGSREAIWGMLADRERFIAEI